MRAKKIVLGFAVVFLLLGAIAALTGCASNGMPKYSDVHQSCINKGGSFEQCDNYARQWCATNICQWGPF